MNSAEKKKTQKTDRRRDTKPSEKKPKAVPQKKGSRKSPERPTPKQSNGKAAKGGKKPGLSPPRTTPQSPKGKPKPDSLPVSTPAPEDDGRGVPQRSSETVLEKQSTSPSAGPKQTKSETVSDLHSEILRLALAESIPEEASDPHVMVAYLRRMHEAEVWASKKIALLQWRQGFVLNRIKDQHQGDWTAWAEAGLPYDVRTALNYRDLATYCTEEEARTIPSTELYDRIADIKAEKKKATPDGLIDTFNELCNKTLAIAKMCEEDDHKNLKTFYEEPGPQLLTKLDKQLEYLGAARGNLKRIIYVIRSIRRQIAKAAEAD